MGMWLEVKRSVAMVPAKSVNEVVIEVSREQVFVVRPSFFVLQTVKDEGRIPFNAAPLFQPP
jgi:hypothetical protein